jgi:hypothetical protein
MVPNHVGIDADWVLHHPDWFLQAKAPPFPSYRFGGPDLSDDPRVGVFLEEGYWSKTDAAVVFRRHDRWTGEDRFIYHGNDGTSMPWNDTAQLDYLRADVRHAVIETILHVAHMFPIIRFDAAMTLAKRHIQRLWFPLPGQGGAIPSRSDYALTQEEFDRLIPIEFWREVVDTVAQRAPDTLLLAEAFWMMEGFFVRTLGMHRVYNSAFMNMLKREENDKYRETIKNVLDFDPEVLKRFVNFMNNPDEETAIAQFGDDDKYFGVCVLMSTMPGLPMFGHGQIEGLREKYGMEYRRARFDEGPNAHLIWRHEEEIFPILHKRYLFSGVAHFALYDFVTESGGVDEDVYAYSNGAGSERALVLFNNRWKSTRGRILGSTHRGSLAQELGIDPHRGEWLVVRDIPHKREYLRNAWELAQGGLVWELGAFKYHVLSDFHPVHATREKPYDRLAAELAGRGVPDIEAAVRELHLRPLHAPLREACSQGHLAYLVSELATESDVAARAALEERLEHVADGLDWMLTHRVGRTVSVERKSALRRARNRFSALRSMTGRAGGSRDATTMPDLHVAWLVALIQVEAVLDLLEGVSSAESEARLRPLADLREDVPEHDVDGEAITERDPKRVGSESPREDEAVESAPDSEPVAAEDVPGVGALSESAELRAEVRAELADEWDLETPIFHGFATIGNDAEARRGAALVILAATVSAEPLGPTVRLALESKRGESFLGVHEAGGVVWLNKERFELLARFFAEREAAFGRIELSDASASADALATLAEKEGYRARAIATKLDTVARAEEPDTRGLPPR